MCLDWKTILHMPVRGRKKKINSEPNYLQALSDLFQKGLNIIRVPLELSAWGHSQVFSTTPYSVRFASQDTVGVTLDGWRWSSGADESKRVRNHDCCGCKTRGFASHLFKVTVNPSKVIDQYHLSLPEDIFEKLFCMEIWLTPSVFASGVRRRIYEVLCY